MSKFKPNDRVIVIDEDENVTKGKIKTDYESIGVAIVELDDGSTRKINYRYLHLDTQPDPQPEEKAVEDVELTEPDEEEIPDQTVEISRTELCIELAKVVAKFFPEL